MARALSPAIASLLLILVGITAVAVSYIAASRILATSEERGSATGQKLVTSLTFPPEIKATSQNGQILAVTVYNPNLDYLPLDSLTLQLNLENGSTFFLSPSGYNTSNCRISSKGILAGESCQVFYDISFLHLEQSQSASVSLRVAGTTLLSTSASVQLSPAEATCTLDASSYTPGSYVLDSNRLLYCTALGWEELPCTYAYLAENHSLTTGGYAVCLFNTTTGSYRWEYYPKGTKVLTCNSKETCRDAFEEAKDVYLPQGYYVNIRLSSDITDYSSTGTVLNASLLGDAFGISFNGMGHRLTAAWPTPTASCLHAMRFYNTKGLVIYNLTVISDNMTSFACSILNFANIASFASTTAFIDLNFTGRSNCLASDYPPKYWLISNLSCFNSTQFLDFEYSGVRSSAGYSLSFVRVYDSLFTIEPEFTGSTCYSKKGQISGRCIVYLKDLANGNYNLATDAMVLALGNLENYTIEAGRKKITFLAVRNPRNVTLVAVEILGGEDVAGSPADGEEISFKDSSLAVWNFADVEKINFKDVNVSVTGNVGFDEDYFGEFINGNNGLYIAGKNLNCTSATSSFECINVDAENYGDIGIKLSKFSCRADTCIDFQIPFDIKTTLLLNNSLLNVTSSGAGIYIGGDSFGSWSINDTKIIGSPGTYGIYFHSDSGPLDLILSNVTISGFSEGLHVTSSATVFIDLSRANTTVCGNSDDIVVGNLEAAVKCLYCGNGYYIRYDTIHNDGTFGCDASCIKSCP